MPQEIEAILANAGRGTFLQDMAAHLASVEKAAFTAYIRKGILPTLPLATQELMQDFCQLALRMRAAQYSAVLQAAIDSNALLTAAAAQHRQELLDMMRQHGHVVSGLLQDEPYLINVIWQQQNIYLQQLARISGVNLKAAGALTLEQRLQQAETQALAGCLPTTRHGRKQIYMAFTR